jgi:hypothetical protein
MSSQWGRIDDDGTVFVRTSSGERVIGSWQAGDAEAGLAYYTRRYDDLATEVTLLEQRLTSGAADPATHLPAGSGSTAGYSSACDAQRPRTLAIARKLGDKAGQAYR